MVSDVGGIDDNSFNENAWAGMERAQDELGVEVTLPRVPQRRGLRAATSTSTSPMAAT